MNENYVVQIIDALAEKFGIAIDWTSQNVLPYMQDLMGRIVNYEIWINAFWMIFLPIVAVVLGIAAYKCIKKAKSIDEYDWIENFPGILGVTFTILCGVAIVATLVMIPIGAIRIIECVNIPEKIFMEYIGQCLN